MKKIFKIVPFILLVFLVGCDGDNDFGFSDSPTLGWVEFLSSETTTSQVADNVAIPLFINVPIFASGLSVNYTLEAVEGDFTPFVSSSNGSLFADPSLNTRNFDVNIGLIGLDDPAGRASMTVFDVVLTSVSNGVNVGVDEFSIVRHRITIPCSAPTVIPSTFALGDYILTVPSGPSLFATPIFTDGITVTLIVGTNGPLSRQFMAPYLPAFSASPETMTFTFDDGDIRGIIIDDTATTTGCASAIIIGGDPSNITELPCDDLAITLDYLDFKGGTGGCGVADQPIQLLLTKI